MNKKLLATVLASTMVLGSVSASASVVVPTPSSGTVLVSGDATTVSGSQITVETSIAPVLINVTLPAEMEILFNPYLMDTTESVLSPGYEIINNGATDVTATITNWNITTPTGVTLLAAPVNTKTSIKKEAFLILQKASDKTAVEAIAFDPLKAPTDKNVIVPAKTAPANLSYGTLAKSNGKIGIQFKGNMSSKVVWAAADTIKAVPTFKFEPTVILN